MSLDKHFNKFQRQTVIGGKQYAISVLPARKGFTVARKITNILLPVLGEGMDSMSDKALLSGQGLGSAAKILVNQMEDADVDSIIFDQLLVGASCNGQAIDPDTHFMANYGEMIELIEFSLRENFESFFTAKGLMTRLMSFLPSTGQETENEESES